MKQKDINLVYIDPASAFVEAVSKAPTESILEHRLVSPLSV